MQAAHPTDATPHQLLLSCFTVDGRTGPSHGPMTSLVPIVIYNVETLQPDLLCDWDLNPGSCRAWHCHGDTKLLC